MERAYVELDADGMNEEGQPDCRAKGDVERSSDTRNVVAAHVSLDGHYLVRIGAGKVCLAFRKFPQGAFLRAEEISAGKLIARDREVIPLVANERCDGDECDARRDDGASLEEDALAATRIGRTNHSHRTMPSASMPCAVRAGGA